VTYTREEDQKFERDWWGDCANTFGEESKQISYAHRMGLQIVPTYTGAWPAYDLGGKSVLDLGGGPTSMLLKCFNLGHAMVVDPCGYPDWVYRRYDAHGVEYASENAEDFSIFTEEVEGEYPFDEAWFYNVLQHTEHAREIVEVAKSHARVVRCFEWIDTERTLGHPTVLTQHDLNEWLGTVGTIENINENGCYGTCYYAVAVSP